jgi:hypothetical protein
VSKSTELFDSKYSATPPAISTVKSAHPEHLELLGVQMLTNDTDVPTRGLPEFGFENDGFAAVELAEPTQLLHALVSVFDLHGFDGDDMVVKWTSTRLGSACINSIPSARHSVMSRQSGRSYVNRSHRRSRIGRGCSGRST